MRKDFVRNVRFTTVEYSIIELEGKELSEKVCEPYTFTGELTERQAVWHLKNVHGKEKNIIIKSIENKEELRKISIENFIKHSTVTTKY